MIPHHASLALMAAFVCRDFEAQAQATEAAAEAERNESAAAQGLSAQLQAESDRRAKVFKNAVKAGVAKVQAELEAERDSLEVRYTDSACLPASTQGRFGLSGAAVLVAAMKGLVGNSKCSLAATSARKSVLLLVLRAKIRLHMYVCKYLQSSRRP